MQAKITYSELSGSVKYYNIHIIVNGKELDMRVTVEDGNASDWHSKDSDKWNAFSNEEKEAVNKEILSYYHY